MTSEKTESYIMELPTDIMLGIFFKLECKDIVSCRDVCRELYNILLSPNFSIDYSRYTPMMTLLVVQAYDCYAHYFFLIHVTANGEFFRRPIKPKVPRSLDGLVIAKVTGSCNGLVLLEQRNSNYKGERVIIYLCNLLLGGCVAIRQFVSINKLERYNEYKFDIVSSTNEIKLLRIGYGKNRRVLEAHILAFKEDDRWRKMKDPLTYLYYWTFGTYLNGVYHWIAKDQTVNGVCTFDFGEEKSGQIPVPPDLRHLSYRMKITKLKNHLCLIEFANTSDDMTIWTMKEYGVAESLSKVVLLRCRFLDICLYNAIPFAILPNGNILLLKYGLRGFYSFSPKTKQFTSVWFREGDPFIFASYVSTYAPKFYPLRMGD